MDTPELISKGMVWETGLPGGPGGAGSDVMQPVASCRKMKDEAVPR